MTVLIAAVALSLTAQVAQARHSLTGWLVATVPALAFLALTKLVLSRTTTTGQHQAGSAGTPHGEQPTGTPDDSTSREPVPPELLTGARMAAFTHRQATGQPITTDTLASHLAIPRTLAGQLLHALDDTATGDTPPSTVTHVNGTSYPAGSRPWSHPARCWLSCPEPDRSRTRG